MPADPKGNIKINTKPESTETYVKINLKLVGKKKKQQHHILPLGRNKFLCIVILY